MANIKQTLATAKKTKAGSVMLKTKKRTNKEPLEETEQMRLVKHLHQLRMAKRIVTFFAPINENKQSFSDRKSALKIEAKNRAMGKQKGVSDLVIIGFDSVLFLELKKQPKILQNGSMSTSNSSVSAHQKKFLEEVSKSNVCDSAIGYGYEHCVFILNKWLDNNSDKDYSIEAFAEYKDMEIKTREQKRASAPF